MSDDMRVSGSTSAAEAMRRIITGFTVSQAVYVVAKLGVADILDSDVPTPIETVAAQVSAQPEPLYRVMRLLAGVGVFGEPRAGRFVLTELGACLRDDFPHSVRQAAVMFAELPYRACGAMLHTVLTGQTAFDYVFGAGHEEYLEAHPADAATFNAAMEQLTAIVDTEIAGALDLTGVESLVDVGGGHGGLLVTVLRANPTLHAVLLDRGSVAEGARRNLAESGLAARAEVVEGDFFYDVPAAPFYLLKSVLHAWPDEVAIEILRRCVARAGRAGRVCVVERIVPEDDTLLYPKVNDLIMLAVTGGRERSVAEYRALFEAAGLRLTDVRHTVSGFSVLLGVAC